jgi:hypothetical protein
MPRCSPGFLLVASTRNEIVANKITLTVAVSLFALSGAAFAGTANAPSRLTTAQVRQSYNWVAPASVDASNTHRYHGGPKSND